MPEASLEQNPDIVGSGQNVDVDIDRFFKESFLEVKKRAKDAKEDPYEAAQSIREGIVKAAREQLFAAIESKVPEQRAWAAAQLEEMLDEKARENMSVSESAN